MESFKIGVMVESFRLGVREGIRKAAEIEADGIQIFATVGENPVEDIIKAKEFLGQYQ